MLAISFDIAVQQMSYIIFVFIFKWCNVIFLSDLFLLLIYETLRMQTSGISRVLGCMFCGCFRGHCLSWSLFKILSTCSGVSGSHAKFSARIPETHVTPFKNHTVNRVAITMKFFKYSAQIKNSLSLSFLFLSISLFNLEV